MPSISKRTAAWSALPDGQQNRGLRSRHMQAKAMPTYFYKKSTGEMKRAIRIPRPPFLEATTSFKTNWFAEVPSEAVRLLRLPHIRMSFTSYARDVIATHLLAAGRSWWYEFPRRCPLSSSSSSSSSTLFSISLDAQSQPS